MWCIVAPLQADVVALCYASRRIFSNFWVLEDSGWAKDARTGPASLGSPSKLTRSDERFTKNVLVPGSLAGCPDTRNMQSDRK